MPPELSGTKGRTHTTACDIYHMAEQMTKVGLTTGHDITEYRES